MKVNTPARGGGCGSLCANCGRDHAGVHRNSPPIGKAGGRYFDIPVYLYEEAAARPDRVNLEDIRRGEYEGIKESIATDPYREPDFGPKVMGSAGAVVIGARQPLIAYNIFLNHSDVSIAEKLPGACIRPVVFTL